MQEFFVANNRVDIPRNQIIREGEVIALEPKILEVLRVLAKHQGEVVSHQTLLDSVWPDIVVAPNALQRCIGQLRKALNDDGKNQRVIATHPKKGYSLLAPVTIRSTVQDLESAPIARQSAKQMLSKKYKYLWLTIAILAAYGSIFLVNLLVPLLTDRTENVTLRPNETKQQAAAPLQRFTRLSPLTATDASEFYSTFSPDGRYVAFSRKVSGLFSHMWILDRETKREIRLTQEPGSYGKPNWSTDGKQLAFLSSHHCSGNCEDKGCGTIHLIFMPLALTEPQPGKALMKCARIPFLGLTWIGDQHLALSLIHI